MMLFLALLLPSPLGFVSAPQAEARTPVFLHLVDEEGRPFTEAETARPLQFTYVRSRSSMGEGQFEWPGSPQSFCTPTRSDVLFHPRLRVAAPFSAGTQTEPGVFRYLLEPGYSYLLGVRGGDVPCQSIQLEVQRPQTSVAGEPPKPLHCSLVVKREPMADLRLQFFSPRGQPQAEGVAFQVEDAETGLPLVSRRMFKSAEQTLGLPRGEYRVRAYNDEGMFWCGNSLHGPLSFGGAVANLSVTEVDHETIELHLGYGGLLHANLTDLPWSPKDDPLRVVIFLLPEGGWPFRPEFNSRRSTSRSRELTTRLRAGEVFGSELIPAGRYQMFGRLYGSPGGVVGQTVPMAIEIRDAVASEAVVLFNPEVMEKEERQ